MGGRGEGEGEGARGMTAEMMDCKGGEGGRKEGRLGVGKKGG